MKQNQIPFLFEPKIQKGKKIRFIMPHIKREDIAKFPIDISTTWNVDLAYGGYGEERVFYSQKDNEKNLVSTHAGLDVFVNIKDKIICPFKAQIISYFWAGIIPVKTGDGVGATLTLAIEKEDMSNFFEQENLDNLFQNKNYLIINLIHLDIEKTSKIFNWKMKDFQIDNMLIKIPENFEETSVKIGDAIAYLGDYEINGGWAHHLHIETYLTNKIEKFKGLESLNLKKKTIFQAQGVFNGAQKQFEIFQKKSYSVNPNLIFKFEEETDEEFELMPIPYSQNTKIINVKNLDVFLEKKQILKDINFNVEQGDFISILGPSGSGKTTLLNSIANLIQTKKESIKFHNVSSIGFVFQNYSLYNETSVFENIYISVKSSNTWNINWYLKNIKSFEKKFHNNSLENEWEKFKNEIYIKNDKHKQSKRTLKKIKFLFKRVIKRLGLNKKDFNLKNDILEQVKSTCKTLGIQNLLAKKPNELSGGQKQRVAIAKAVAKEPDILILDEPFSSLDYKVKISIRDWLKKLQKKLKITTIFVTHDQDDAMWLSDKIIFINKGRLEQYGTPEELFLKPNNLFIAKFIGVPEINFIKEDHDLQYYMRGNKIKLIHKQKAAFVVSNVSTTGNYYVVTVKNEESAISVITTKNYKIGDRVSLVISKNEMLKFDKITKKLVK